MDLHEQHMFHCFLGSLLYYGAERCRWSQTDGGFTSALVNAADSVRTRDSLEVSKLGLCIRVPPVCTFHPGIQPFIKTAVGTIRDRKATTQ